MSDLTPDTARQSAARLDAIYAERDRAAAPQLHPCVGIFGNGVPEVLIEAAGATPVHLSMGVPSAVAAHSEIDAVIEPFVDEEVRLFLRRLMTGAFADYRGIVFARDDAPALIAYHYATEWVRQGRVKSGVPPLFLWNLVHSANAPVKVFNGVQADKLIAFFEHIGLRAPGEEQIVKAGQHEGARRAALAKLGRVVGRTVTGGQAMRWRNAGRFIPACEHAELLEQATQLQQDIAGAPRLGLVGSPLACTRTYEMLESFGPLVCDLQPWGSVWPIGSAEQTDLDTILHSIASDAFCPRISPSNLHRKAIVEAAVAAKCDLVLCQLAQTDDTFGWEIPGLAAGLEKAGIGFVNLGFRDATPNEAWLERASRLIEATLKVPA